MLRAELVKVGGVNKGAAVVICARLSPELKPETNAALEDAAMDAALPGAVGAMGTNGVLLGPPGTTNVFFNGELVSNRVATVPGKISEKRPTPPRITVLPWP